MFSKEIQQDRFPTGGLNQLAQIPYYDSSQINDTVKRLDPGSWWADDNSGNAFMYVKAGATLANAQLVAQAAPGTDTVVNAGSTTSVINLTTGGLTVNAETGNYAYFQSIPALRYIKANAAASLTVAVRSTLTAANVQDADVLASVPTNASNVGIIRPWNVIVSTASTVPIGVALGAVTSGNYTVIQIAGLAMVLAVGSVTALVAMTPVIPGAGGTVTGIPNQVTANPLVDLYSLGTSMISSQAYSGASLALPVFVNFMAV